MTFDDRSPVIYGRNDLFGAFARDDMGVVRADGKRGRRQREFAFGWALIRRMLFVLTTSETKSMDQFYVDAMAG